MKPRVPIHRRAHAARHLVARGVLLLLCGAAGAGVADAGPDGATYAVRAKAVYPVTAEQPGPIVDGMILVRDGRIVAVGRELDVPPDVPLYVWRDETIIPGLVDAGSALVAPHQGNESVSGAYAALDAFDAYADYTLALSRGTTTAHVGPGGHRLVAGVGAVVKLAGNADERVLRPESDLTVNLGVFDPPRDWDVNAFASSDVPIRPAERQRPDSRLGQYLELEQRIAGVGGLLGRRGASWRTRTAFDLHAQRFAEVWRSATPLRIQVRRAADIAGALALLRRHERAGYLVGMTEADALGDALRDANVPAVVRIDASLRRPGPDVGPDPEALAPADRPPARLRAARIALTGGEAERAADLRLIAALAVSGGMSEEAALAAVTRTPAELLGVADRVGSLAPGRDADFLVLTAGPLDPGGHVVRCVVNGRTVFGAPGWDDRPQAPPAARRGGRASEARGHADARGPATVIRAGTVWVGNGQVIRDASILIEDGRIAAVGNRVPHPPFAKVIDAGGDGYVTPGFIDAHGHLGLEGDQTPVTPDLPLANLVGVPGREFLRVAQAGVTTVLLAAYRAAPGGSRVAAVKTYGRERADMVLRPLSAMKFSLRGGDPLLGVDEIRKVIEAGRKYDEEWKKYAEELKKWEQARASGGAAAEKSAAELRTESDEGRPDPITGTWSYMVSGGPIPEGVGGTLTLRLTGDRIEGRITTPDDPQPADVSGRLNGRNVTLEVDQETPIGRPRIEAVLDREDHMSGSVLLGEFRIGFEATRTDKSAPEFRIAPRRTRGKSGRPLPPKVNEALEPVRQWLARKVPALVDAQTAGQIAAALRLIVEEHKLPLVLLNAEEADRLADRLSREGVGVVVPSEIVRQRDDRPYSPSAELSRQGVRVALQSDAEDGARDLPRMGLFAVQQGLGGDAALAALTIEAARMFGIEDRVGSLEKGKDADVLIFRGHPFDGGSRLERVIVGGLEVPDE